MPHLPPHPDGCDVLVIGAGMAGLVAARQLVKSGLRVAVADKGRGVGGRMASRRVDGVPCDHGAQFITVRDPRFSRLMERWLAEGIATEWSRGFPSQGSLAPASGSDGHPRYCGVPSMTAIPKWLAQGLDVRVSLKATCLELGEFSFWRTTFVREGQPDTAMPLVITSRAILLTAPAEQSLALLNSGNAQIPSVASDALKRIAYDPCFAVMATLDGPPAIPPPGGLKLGGEPIAWIADNRAKGTTGGRQAITIHAGPEFTRNHWEADRGEVGRLLLAAASPHLGDAKQLTVDVHRWKYSLPSVLHPEACLLIEAPSPLVVAGDAFAGPRVEGAALSGLAAADALWKLLTSGAFSPNFDARGLTAPPAEFP